MTYIIPSFSSGQRVRVIDVPIELRCPICGESPTWDDTPLEGHIIGRTPSYAVVECRECRGTFPISGGYYDVLLGMRIRAVPWTRLESLE